LVGSFMARQEPIYVLDRELIQRIQPDLILAQDLCRVCAVPSGQVEDALAELGCRSEVVSLDPRTLDDVLDGIETVGRATGRPAEAAAMGRALRERVERVRSRVGATPAVRTLCLEWSDPPFVGGHWVPEMVTAAGGTNLLNGPGQPSRRATWDEIEAASPEVIVFMPCGYGLEDAAREGGALFGVPEFASTPAAREGRVFAVDASSYFSRPGPRIVDGVEILAWILSPTVFPDPPAERVARVGTASVSG